MQELRTCGLSFTEDEKLLLDFAEFEFAGMQYAMDQFLSKTNFEYDEAHVQRLFDEYNKAYIKLQAVRKIIDDRYNQ